MAEISQYLKPQSPLQISNSGTINGIYPLTTYDQIITKENKRVYDIEDITNVPHLYSATFSLSSWEGEGPFTQTVALSGNVNLVEGMNATFCSAPMCEQTSDEETNKNLLTSLSAINSGYCTLNISSSAATITAKVFTKPTTDITVKWLISIGKTV